MRSGNHLVPQQRGPCCGAFNWHMAKAPPCLAVAMTRVRALRLCRWPSVQTVAQKVFTWRLRLLPYHYSAFFDAHTFGCPVMRPTFLSFPGDASTLPLAEQWMLGDALLVRPIGLAGATCPCTHGDIDIYHAMHGFGRNKTARAWLSPAAASRQPAAFSVGELHD